MFFTRFCRKNLILIPGSTRAGAGTPQFQNLAGTIRTSANGLIPSSTPSSNNSNNSATNQNQINQNNSEPIRTNQNNSAQSRTTLTSLFHNGTTPVQNSGYEVLRPIRWIRFQGLRFFHGGSVVVKRTPVRPNSNSAKFSAWMVLNYSSYVVLG